MVAAMSVDEVLRGGEWVYPHTNTGNINISVWFELVLFSGIMLSWTYETLRRNFSTKTAKYMSNETRDEKKDRIKQFCLKGSKIGSNHLTAGVEYINCDEYAILFATSVSSAYIFFKIIGGASGVGSGHVLAILLCALLYRLTKQSSKGRVKFMFGTVLALSAVLFAFMARTNSISLSEKTGYVFAGVFLLLAAFVKMLLTIRPLLGVHSMNNESKEDAYERYLDERAYAMIDGEWLYELSGSSVVVIGGSLTVFLFTQCVTVAMAATRWYAVPFYALYPIVFQQLGMLVYNMTNQYRVTLSNFFNITFVILGGFILLMLQGQACSLPGGRISEFATGEHPYCPRIGGLRRPEEGGLHLYRGWTIVLEVFSALFFLMAYCSMVYTSKTNAGTVENICTSDTHAVRAQI